MHALYDSRLVSHFLIFCAIFRAPIIVIMALNFFNNILRRQHLHTYFRLSSLLDWYIRTFLGILHSWFAKNTLALGSLCLWRHFCDNLFLFRKWFFCFLFINSHFWVRTLEFWRSFLFLLNWLLESFLRWQIEARFVNIFARIDYSVFFSGFFLTLFWLITNFWNLPNHRSIDQTTCLGVISIIVAFFFFLFNWRLNLWLWLSNWLLECLRWALGRFEIRFSGTWSRSLCFYLWCDFSHS